MDFPAQLHSFRRTTLGDLVISLTVDKSFSNDLTDLIKMETGAQLNVTLEQDGVITEETNNLSTKERFWKKMHSHINELAKMGTDAGTTPEAVKERLKQQLKENGLIKDSTKELDIKGLAVACNILENWMES